MKRGICAALLAVLAIASAAFARPYGDSIVVAKLPPAPGYPEGIAINGGMIYVATAARFGTSLIPPPGPPEVQVFHRVTGQLLHRIAIKTKDPTQDHGTSGLAFDGAYRLYVLDTQWGLLRLPANLTTALIDPAATPSVIYGSAFPNLPPCTPLATVCSPTLIDAPPLPNDIAFAPNGDAYVTDSLQATIWRIPAGGGGPLIWFQDERLAGGFGVNGIRLSPARDALYVTVTADNQGAGRVYRVPLYAPSAMTVVHTYSLAEAPDNLAFGSSGRIYVALAGSNQISVLSPDGTEVTRFSGPAKSSSGDVPYDMPSGVAIDGSTGTLLANNHSEVLGLPRHFIVFDVVVGEGPEPLVRPIIP